MLHSFKKFPRGMIGFGVLLLAGLACAPEHVDPPSACVPGETQECLCPAGQVGAQACRSDGQGWESCLCSAVGDAGGQDAGAVSDATTLQDGAAHSDAALTDLIGHDATAIDAAGVDSASRDSAVGLDQAQGVDTHTGTDASVAQDASQAQDAGQTQDSGLVADASVVQVAHDHSIAEVQNVNNSNHPEVCPTTVDICDPVRLTNVVVTSPVFGISRETDCLDVENNSGCPYYLFGFYVADPNAVDANGRLLPWSGIKVTVIPGPRWIRDSSCDNLYGEDLLNCGSAGSIDPNLSTNYSFDGFFAPDADRQNLSNGFPQVGDVITLVAQPAEYYGMTQMGKLTTLTRSGNTADNGSNIDQPLPALFDGDVSSITSGLPRVPLSGDPVVRAALPEGTQTEAYEGVMIELRNVVALDACVDYPYNNNPNQMQDFGYFRVAGNAETTSHLGVEIGTFFHHQWGGWWRSPINGGPAYSERTCANTVNKCDDYRHPDQGFSSIVGFLDFSYDVHRLEPVQFVDLACSTDCAVQVNPYFCE